MRSPPIPSVLRCAASAGLSILIVAVFAHLRHVNHTIVALVLVLLILGLSIRWGWMEALAASLAGGLGFDYFFPQASGFGPEDPEHGLTLIAFLLTAIATGQLSARANRHRKEAELRRDEMAGLYRFGNALLHDASVDIALERIPEHIVEIFRARTAVLFDPQDGKILRSGPAEVSILDERLREVAATGDSIIDDEHGTCVVPVWRSGNLAGSLGIAGVSLSRSMVEAISERVGVALARAYTTQESMAAEVARRSENLKSAVLDALAHEIKGPLSTIKVSVSSLMSQKPDEAQQRELLSIIDEESDRIECWIDDAIRVSRGEARALRLEKKPNSIKDVVARALEALGSLATGRSIEVRIPESFPMAQFDAAMIERVIWLLVDNALKYSPPDSPIGISAEFTGAEVVLSVEDHGCGVPQTERERIFEKYYRGSAATRACQEPGWDWRARSVSWKRTAARSG
jgi:two-component system sensor histidine kinase KdpD